MSGEWPSKSRVELLEELSTRERALITSANIIDDQWSDERVEMRGESRKAVAKWRGSQDGGPRYQLIETSWRPNPQYIQFNYTLSAYQGSNSKPIMVFAYDTSVFQKMLKMNEKGKMKKCKKEEIEELVSVLQSATSTQVVDNDTVNEVFDGIIDATNVHDQIELANTEPKRTFAQAVLRLLNRSSNDSSSTS